MVRMLRVVMLFMLGGLLLVGGAVAKTNKTAITFVYTGDLGKVYYDYQKPDETLIKAFETKLVQEQRKKGEVVFLDTGHFIEPPVVSETSYVSRPIRFFQQAGFSAVNVTPRELVGGTSYVEAWKKLSPTPPLVSSLQSSAGNVPLAPLSRTAEVKGIKIGIIGATDVAQVSTWRDVVKQFQTADIVATVKAETVKLAATHDLVVVLSDLEPARNEEIARETPSVDIVFENGLKSGDTVRKVGKTLIASRSGAFAYDRLIIQIEAAHTIAEHRAEAIFYGPKPGDKGYGEIVPLPEIGAELPNLDLLKHLSASFERVEAVRTTAGFQASRIANSTIHYYKVHNGDALLGDAYYVRHYLGAGHANFNWLILLDTANKVKDIYFFSAVTVGMQWVELYDFRAEIVAKDPRGVTFDMNKLRGVEEYFAILKSDLAAVGEINAKVQERRAP